MKPFQNTSSLFSKVAEDDEQNLPHALEYGMKGAESGLPAGVALGAFQHMRNSGKPQFSLIGKTPAGKRAAIANRAIDAGVQMGYSGLLGAGAGFALGGGLGAYMDQYGVNKQQYRQEVEDEKREYLRQKIEEMRMDREATNHDLAHRLSKTAGMLDGIRRLTGSDYRKATKAYENLNSMDGFASMPPEQYFGELHAAEAKMKAEQQLRDEAQQKALPIAAGTGLFGGLVGAGMMEDKRINNRIMDELLSQEQGDQDSPTGLDGQKRQGAGSVSNAPAGADKTASYSPLFRPFEKTAGPLNFIKNFTNHNVNKAQNRLNEISNVPRDLQKRYEYTQEAAKDVRNAKVDRNRARLGGGLALGAAGAGVGGYNAYQKSKNPEEENTMNQFSNYEQKVAFESMMGRLEKTAGPRDMAQNLAGHAGDALAAARAGGADALVSARNLGQDALRGVQGFGNDVIGTDYRNLKAVNENVPGGMPAEDIAAAKKQMLLAQGLAGGGALGAGGAGYALANAGGDEDEEQVAFTELMERLEKTAAPGAGLFNKAKGALGNAKYKAQMGVRDFTGANEKATAQNMQRAWNDDKTNSLSVSQFKNQHEKLKGANDAAKARKDKSRKGAAGAAGLAAAGGGAAAAANSKKDREKEASNVLNGLYKEAASAIVDESLPAVRQHVDPMDRITFSK
ncbi:hypothetical protein [Priestia megaterium]|uniref:hypothetical protein n=1 Tax=Priestia megaterium TaxID=1404 RepID=UPI002E23251E|nr:hypothetical protein [Priestia megaterium]